jgi:hypothetical protein
METETVAGEKKNDSKPNLLAIIGGALLLISFFLPWVEWVVSIPGFRLLAAADPGAEKLLFYLTWLIPIGGLLTGFLGYTKNRYSGAISIVVGISGLAILVWFYLSLSYQLMGKFKSAGFGDTLQVLGFGVYVAAVGCLILLGAAAWKQGKSDAIRQVGAT